MTTHRTLRDDAGWGLSRDEITGRPRMQTQRWLEVVWSYEERAPLGRLTGFEVVIVNGANPADSSTYITSPVIVQANVRRYIVSVAVTLNVSGARSAVRAVYGNAKSAWVVQGIGKLIAAEQTEIAGYQEAVDAHNAAVAAQADADLALSGLNDIGADSLLTRVEKKTVVREWNEVLGDHSGILAQALALGITAERVSYDNAVIALQNYLGGLSPSWSDSNSDTSISRTIWNTNWQDMYAKRQVLLNKVADEAAKKANWDRVTGRPSEAALLNNMIDPSVWVSGTQGSQGPFSQNGGTYENAIFTDVGPYGPSESLWQCGVDVNSDSDGGWNCPVTAGFDHRKSYRLSVWVRTNMLGNGSHYLGCDSGGGTVNLNNTANNNPYFYSGDLPAVNRWFLLVGVLHGSGYAGGSSNLSGVYDPLTGQRVLAGTDYKNAVGATAQTHRAYLYYATSASKYAWFARPRVDELNGNEPSLIELLGSATVGATATEAAAIVTAQNTAAAAQSAASAAQGAATAAQADANSATAQLSDIAADGKLTPNEKRDAIARRTDLLNEQSGIEAEATTLGITSEKTNYTSAIASLNSYLGGLSPAWNSTSTTTTISRTVWNGNWSWVYLTRQVLLNKIAQVAATRASWASVASRPYELTDGRVGNALQSTGQLWDQRNMPQVNTGGGGTALGSGSPITAADVGSTARVTIAAHSRQYGFGSISLNAGSVSGLSFVTKYHIYYDDPSYVGGAVSYFASTNVNTAVGGNGRVYLGAITTPSNGGGSSNPPPQYCVAVDQWLTDSLLAEHCVAGNIIDTWADGYETNREPIRQAILKMGEPCVEIVTASGARVVVSTTSPVETFDHLTVEAQCALDCLVGVLHGKTQTVTPEKVVEVNPAGVRDVMRISVGDISYAAGTDAAHRIITHNGTQKP